MGERILALLQQGRSYNEIIALLGCAKSTVHYHARKLGMTETRRRYDWASIQAHHDSGVPMSRCMEHFGFSKDAWAKAAARGDLRPNERRIPLEDLLVAGRSTGRRHLKQRLISAGLLQAHCYACGLTEWRGQPLSLELHHLNGDKNDNRRGNLTVLCPNCHSQTPNYCGRNKHGR